MYTECIVRNGVRDVCIIGSVTTRFLLKGRMVSMRPLTYEPQMIMGVCLAMINAGWNGSYDFYVNGFFGIWFCSYDDHL